MVTLTSIARRVDLDVVVTDGEGLAVTGLNREDFEVVEDGAPQAVQTFDVHAFAPTNPSDAPKTPSLPSNTFLNLQTARESGAPTILLYDGVNTVAMEQNYARRALLQFVKHRPPGTPVAIFVLGARLHMLQGFTDDTDLLTAALESTKAKTQAIGLQATQGGYLEPTPGGMEGDLVFTEMLAHFAAEDMGDQMARAAHRRTIAADALCSLGRFLASMPGRKSLIWLSSDFPISGAAWNLLTLSRTAVYPVDIKGIKANPAFDATRNLAFGPDPGAFGMTAMTSAFIENAGRRWMETLAEVTGGHAFYGTNDLAGAVKQASFDGSTYYSLSYEPTNPKYDGSLRHIKVTLKQPGYTLAYRKTYYADDLNAVARAAADSPVSPLTPALERGTPLDHGLLVEAHLEAAGAPVPATPEQMRVLAQYAAMRGDGSSGGRNSAAQAAPPVMMQQYVVTYALVAHQLEMPASDSGNREASLEFGAIAYDEEGRKLNGLDTRIDDPVSADRYAKLLAQGYRVQQPLWIPASAKTLRLAVRDVTGNRTGSLEIPLPLAKPAEASTEGGKAPAK